MTLNDETKVRFRHFRGKNRTPVGTMATLETNDKIFAGFVFCSNNDFFKKKFGRELALKRAMNLYTCAKKEQKYAVETDKDNLVNFINKLKKSTVSSSGGFRRITKKHFNLKENYPKTTNKKRIKKFIFPRI